MIILGIDPGTTNTGYGVIEEKRIKTKRQKFLKCLDYGVIQTSPLLTAEERLKKIHLDLLKIIKKHRPDVMAVENIYFFKNLKTAMPVSQAKGVILLAAAQKKITVHEFTPLQAKMAITGHGRAKKHQIQEIIKLLLNLKKTPSPDDAADALAIAICCSCLCAYEEKLTN